MRMLPYVKTSLSPSLYLSLAFAPSHRKEQRHNSHVPTTTRSGERGGSEGTEAKGGHRRSHARTYAQVGPSVGRIPATCGKKITFPVSLLAQEEGDGGRGRQREQAGRRAPPRHPVFFYFSHLVLRSNDQSGRRPRPCFNAGLVRSCQASIEFQKYVGAFAIRISVRPELKPKCLLGRSPNELVGKS